MSEFFYDDIYDRIDSLAKRERELRSEIHSLRQERAKLKSQCNYTFINERLEFIKDLPEEFWYPSHITAKVISDLNPSLQNRNVPPDLADWQRTSGLKEFLVNIGLGIGMAIIGLQIFFFLL